MRDSRRFWNRAGAQCETPVASGTVQARNGRHASLLESCKREDIGDSRRFWNRAGAKRETPVVFGVLCAKCQTFLAVAILVTVSVFGFLNKEAL